VLRAAIALADEGGLEGLSMRKLARQLGVEPMSIYYYCAKKDDLLDGILDLVIEEIPLVTFGAEWKSALRRSALSAHEALERHPWACGLMMSPARIRQARIRYMNSMLGHIRRAGFSAEQTDRAYHALDSHIIGSTLWGVGYAVESSPLNDFASEFLRSFPADEYPYLVEHVEQHRGLPEAGEVTFEFGLDLILDGLDRLLLAD
jgi:AcrR family transcriptional regulator